MYQHEKIYTPGIDGTNNCCMFTLPLKGWYRSLSATQPSIFEIGVYWINFNETWHLSFVVNLKFNLKFSFAHCIKNGVILLQFPFTFK